MKLTYEINSINSINELKTRRIEAEVKEMSPKLLPKIVEHHRLRFPNEEIIRVFLKEIIYVAGEDLIP